jgi:glucose-6-phosphate 1-dehydrogenase
MDEPESFGAHSIRKKRAAILNKLISPTSANVATHAYRAQYDGYRNTEGVHQDSETETYFEFKAYIDTDTWRDVPFYVRSGKALKEEAVEVAIVFRDVATGPFETKALPTVGNTVVLSISPQYAMHITLNVKSKGHGFLLAPKTLSYVSNEENELQINAYEKVLLDCIVSDHTLFTSADEVLASWKFITALREAWSSVPLQAYTKGTDGPLDSFWEKNKKL